MIIADEPTSALDVVVQRQVMATLARVQQELGAAVILIGHDMGLMAQFVDRLGVMYAGRLVEVAPIAEIITDPRHPYTRALIARCPRSRGGARSPASPVSRRCCAICRRAAPSTRAVRRRPIAAASKRPVVREMAGARVACHLA